MSPRQALSESKHGNAYLISVTSDLSSFCSSSLAASRIGMTSASAVSASAFSTAMILFCSSISMAFSSASFFFSSAAGRGAGEMLGCSRGNLSVWEPQSQAWSPGRVAGGSGHCDGRGAHTERTLCDISCWILPSGSASAAPAWTLLAKDPEWRCDFGWLRWICSPSFPHSPHSLPFSNI